MEKYTPEKKAELQQSRTLSDAELIKGAYKIKGGAKYMPDLEGNPILMPTEEQKLRLKEEHEFEISELNWKESPESFPEIQKISKLYEKLKSNADYSTLFNVSRRGFYSGGTLITPDKAPRETKLSSTFFAPAENYRGRDGEYDSYVSLKNDGKERPHIRIYRTNGAGEYKEESVIKCYSLQEFYDNLTPREKEKGEALGKELESYLGE